MSSTHNGRLTRAGLVVGLASLTAVTLVATPGFAVPQRTGPIPVPAGYYGYADPSDPDIIGFKVRHRKIIDPRFSIQVECEHSDGTTQSIVYGPSRSDPSRRFRIPANGNGRVSWVQREDPSLIPNATLHLGFTFFAHRRPMVTAEVEASYSEPDPAGGTWTSTCYGVRPFRLDRG